MEAAQVLRDAVGGYDEWHRADVDGLGDANKSLFLQLTKPALLIDASTVGQSLLGS